MELELFQYRCSTTSVDSAMNAKVWKLKYIRTVFRAEIYGSVKLDCSSLCTVILPMKK